ncbi:MAG TPA: CapA family protein [bacterium]|nr:CapA family protein [bacterium]
MSDSGRNIRIVIAGDTAPIRSNRDVFMSASGSWLHSDLKKQIEAVDAFIVNLECPLLGDRHPAKKSGWVLSAPRECAQGLSKAGITAVNLANNHSMDHGIPGLISTMSVLQSEGIDHFGAGENFTGAAQPHVVFLNGKSVALMGLTTADSKTADIGRAGTMPMELPRCLPVILDACRRYDHVIVQLHAGLERYPYPSPGLQTFCRCLVDLGVCCVLCQHSHCIGSTESWKNGVIVYGQGNFLFDWGHTSNDPWNYGLLLCIELQKDLPPIVTHTVTRQTFPGVEPASSADSDRILHEFEQRSLRIRDIQNVEIMWQEQIESIAPDYLYPLTSRWKILRKIFRRLGISRWALGENRARWLGAVIENRDLREVMRTVLEMDGDSE